MGTYTLTTFKANLRYDLKDSGALWSDEELDRSVERAIQDIDRFFPLEAVYDYTIDYTVTAESTTAPAVGTYVALGYKPIKPGSMTLTTDPAGTTYTIDTDYTMDYANGKYTIISTGSITEADSLLATYTKSRLGIDLSAIITDYVRIIAVEYPVDKVPQQFVSYNIWNNFMYIGSQKLGESQTQLTDKEHIALYYEMPHTQPTVGVAGSYPAFMDEVICIGAAGYAMFIKAAQYEHQAVTDLATVRTTLTGVSHTATEAALGKVDTFSGQTAAPSAKKYLDDGDAILASMDATTYLTGTAAPAAKYYLTTGDDKLNLVNVGSEVPGGYSNYARTCVEIAIALGRQAELYSTYAQRSNEISNAFIGEAIQRNAINQLKTAASDRYLNTVLNDIELADRFRAEGIERRNEFWSILRDKSEYRKRVVSTPVTQPR